MTGNESVLLVFFGDKQMGEVHRQRGGELTFRYDEDYLREDEAVPLSLSMPLFEKEYADDKVSPFLWGLLPDNEQILQRWARSFQVSATSCFGLLKEVGEDCAGAIRFITPEEAGRADKGGKSHLKSADIEKRLEELRRNPAMGRSPQDRGQFSLGGAQAKTALQRRGTQWFLPWGSEPTTHILKPPRPDLDGHVENEHFCLRLAQSLGLRTAASEIIRFDKEIAIVIERYDRLLVDSQLLRLHMWIAGKINASL